MRGQNRVIGGAGGITEWKGTDTNKLAEPKFEARYYQNSRLICCRC